MSVRVASRVALSLNEIHLWLAFYDRITDERLHCTYRELLDRAEREQESRFYFRRDRRRYLVTRALVRTVLSRYVSIDPADWIFRTNPYGRPEVSNPEAQGAHLSFNISHTHSLIVLGVRWRGALGVDVENIRARDASLDLAKHFFAPVEAAALAAIPHCQQQYRFFEYWTFKEAYIKARGMGLSLPLDKFSFHYPNDRTATIEIHPELADDPSRWQFWQFRPTPEYLVAVCAERVDARVSKLVVRVVSPGIGESAIEPELLRTSQ
jgi:4'-phosphopantetheinyl transferase